MLVLTFILYGGLNQIIFRDLRLLEGVVSVLYSILSLYPLAESRHFPKKHKLHQIFNRNNVKVSYSCLPNVSNIIILLLLLLLFQTQRFNTKRDS